MANIKSAKKRIDVIDRRHSENKFVKATISTMIKKFRKLVEEGKVEEAEKYSKEVYSYIDSACSKGIIHKNNASRKVGRLAELLYKAKSTTPATKEVKVEETKVEEVKVEEKVEEKPAKKTTKKTTTTKKTAEEKPATEKKTTAKKTTKKAE